jgi:hypothetical protein
VSFDVVVVPDETITVLVLKLVNGPEGDTEAERVIVPAKLLMLETVMVLLAFEPWRIERLGGLEETPKAGGWTTKFPTIEFG